jgi:hypothetical protein
MPEKLRVPPTRAVELIKTARIPGKKNIHPGWLPKARERYLAFFYPNGKSPNQPISEASQDQESSKSSK